MNQSIRRIYPMVKSCFFFTYNFDPIFITKKKITARFEYQNEKKNRQLRPMKHTVDAYVYYTRGREKSQLARESKQRN
jgi:hypothetical protein